LIKVVNREWKLKTALGSWSEARGKEPKDTFHSKFKEFLIASLLPLPRVSPPRKNPFTIHDSRPDSYRVTIRLT